MKKLTAWIGADQKTRIYSWSLTDLYQMEDECYLKGIDLAPCFNRWMDFQAVYGRLIGYRHQLSLKNAVASANGQFSGMQAHTALYDAMATAELLIMTTSKDVFDERTKSIRELLAPQKKCTTTIGELYGAQLARFLV